jgi:hypothetical protein
MRSLFDNREKESSLVFCRCFYRLEQQAKRQKRREILTTTITIIIIIAREERKKKGKNLNQRRTRETHRFPVAVI